MSSSQAASPTSTTDGPSSSNAGSSPAPPASSTANAATTTTSPPPVTTTTTPQTTTTSPTPTTQPQTSSHPTTTTTSPTTSPTTATTTWMTSSIPTTIFSTNPAGSTVFVTTDIVSIYPTIGTNPTTTNTTTTNSHTAAIIGGSIGGVVGVALFAIFLFCVRRKVRKDEFDGDFDPDRVVGHSGGGGTLPQVDLADEVTPFPHPYSDHDDGSMRQRPYGDSAYPPIVSSSGSPRIPGSVGTPSDIYYPAGAGSSQEGSMPPQGYVRPGVGPSSGGYQLPMNVNMYGTGPADWHTPVPMASPPPSTVTSLATASGRTAKEREASGRGQALGLATQPEGGEVVVHQDAGRAPSEEHPPPREIPPTYDSIRQD